MAFRKIHDGFWTDPDVEEMTPEQKYFYLYLLTNPAVNQLGIYELSKKRACFETGYSMDTVSILLQYFIDTGKIVVSDTTNEIIIVKFYFHNKSESPKLQQHIKQLLTKVKDKVLIQYIYGMCTLSQEEEEKEEEKEEESGRVINYSNQYETAWVSYGRKGGKAKAYIEWNKLSQENKDKVMRHIPSYVASKPDRRYRRDFERYLRDGLYESIAYDENTITQGLSLYD
jgi:hypothetical protein